MEEDFSKYNGEGTTLRKAQLRMLDILIEVDKICRKHNIPYWLDGGTLLGAVRHGGFIPWDDDLDIAVLKKDYLKLRKILLLELPPNMIFQDWKNEKKFLMKFGKVRDKNSYYNEEYFKKGDLLYQGIFIDIFPMTYIPSIPIHKFVNFFYGRAYRRIHGYPCIKTEYIIAKIIWPLIFILYKISNFLICFAKRELVSNMYGNMVISYHNVKDIFPVKEIEFEKHKFYAPYNSDKYLKDLYGDYMKIPAENNRQIHAVDIVFYE